MKMIPMLELMKKAEKADGLVYFNMDEYRLLKNQYIERMLRELGDARRSQNEKKPHGDRPMVVLRAVKLKQIEMMEEIVPTVEYVWDDLLAPDINPSAHYAGEDKPKESLFLVRNIVLILMPKLFQMIEMLSHKNFMDVLSRTMTKKTNPNHSKELDDFVKRQTALFLQRNDSGEYTMLSALLTQTVIAAWVEPCLREAIHESTRNSLNTDTVEFIES